jgi:protein O-mannosyl-transferase
LQPLRPRAGQAAPTPPLPWFGRAAIFLLLVGAAFVAYINADHEEFLFDDVAGNLILNPQTADLHSAVRSIWQNPFGAGEQVARLTFAMNCAFNKAVGLRPLDVTSFLVFNVAVHALNVCLVYLLVRVLLSRIDPRLGRSIGLPLALALLFAVHPIHASSIAYIAQRRGTMATAFYLLAILAYLRVRGGDATNRSWKQIALAAAIPLCYWLSYRCKSMGLTLPLTILMIEFCLRAPDRIAFRRYLPYLATGLVVCLGGGLLFLWALGLFDAASLQIQPYASQALHSPREQFLTESRVFVHYWKLLLLPLPQWMCVDHGYDLSRHLTDGLTLPALVFHAGMLGLAVLAAFRRWTLAAIGIFWFYITLLPYAVVPQADLFVEYKTYLASIGLTLILAELIRRVPIRAPAAAKVIVATAIMAVLLFTTIRRNEVYQSAVNFWSDVVEKYPGNPRAQHNLAGSLRDEGRRDEAVRHCREAIRLAPDYADAHIALGAVLDELGQDEEAMKESRIAQQLNPSSFDVHYNIANLLLKSERTEEAIQEYQQAKSIDPTRLKVYIMCADAFARQNLLDEAISELLHGLQAARPDEDPVELVRAHYNMANAYSRLGQLDSAIREYRSALALSPKYFNAYYGLGLVMEKQGRPEEAIKAYQNALAIEQDFAAAQKALDAVRANPDRLRLPGK